MTRKTCHILLKFWTSPSTPSVNCSIIVYSGAVSHSWVGIFFPIEMDQSNLLWRKEQRYHKYLSQSQNLKKKISIGHLIVYKLNDKG